MAKSISKTILVGNLGNDPEVKYTQGGMAITRASLATTSVRKDKDGNKQEQTQWHRLVFFGTLGEIAGEHLKKGALVYVEGEIRYSDHTGDDGQKRYYTDIVVNDLSMLGGKKSDEAGSDGGSRSGGYGNRSQNAGGSSNQPPAFDESAAATFDDDDYPF